MTLPPIDTAPRNVDVWLLDDSYEMLTDAGVPFEWLTGDDRAVWVPTIPEDAPPAVRESIVRRRLSMLEGRCPCGVRWVPNYEPGQVSCSSIVHRDHCPALNKRLRRNIRRWKDRR